MRILIASTADAQKLCNSVSQLGHICDEVTPFREAPEVAVFDGSYDAVLLQAAGSITEALPVIREIRARGLSVPVVILCGKLRMEEEQEAFNLGADDVLTTPISLQLVVVRLQAIQRRILGHKTAVLGCGNVTLDQSCRRVAVDGNAVRLTTREFDVLETLMLRRGVLLTKELFMSRAYNENDGPNARILDVFVCKLRRKLAAAGAAEIVRTVWGSGYSLREPSEAEVALARQHLSTGKPRKQRAHLAIAA
ncbi:response regulator transcription factor [Muricoccus vinaceus]|uniref:Response regulator transcription factor n=1 Tax=Muricoccus vinaceus TaxID=424704 RepID=A0ABV6ISR4_9PROT